MPQIVKSRPSNLSAVYDLYPFDPRGMKGKNSLHADPIGNLSYGEGCSNSPLSFPDDYTLEDLYPLLFPLDDLEMYLYRIPDVEIEQIHPHLFLINRFQRIHLFLLLSALSITQQSIQDNGRRGTDGEVVVMRTLNRGQYIIGISDDLFRQTPTGAE